MNTKKYQHLFSITCLVLALSAPIQSARANVYATNIKINGVLTGSATAGSGVNTTISYILNEPAGSGVTINIYSGATVVRTINVAGGGAGALQGLNTAIWNGKDNSNDNVATGNYNVTGNAATPGYSVWTQIVNHTNNKLYW